MISLEKFIRENNEKLVEIHWNDILNDYTKNMILSKIVLDNLSKEEFFKEEVSFFESINQQIEDYVENGFFQLYIAEKEDFEPSISIDKVIEDLQEQVYDELDDEDYLENLKDKEKEELEESLNLVLKRFLKK